MGRGPLEYIPHTDVVKQLIDASAAVNKEREDDGATPLLMASQNRHTDVVNQLIDASADVNKGREEDVEQGSKRRWANASFHGLTERTY